MFTMVMLEIKALLKEGQHYEVKKRFNENFAPAIRHQSGFCNALFLEQLENRDNCMILLFFDTEKQRLEWRRSDEHDPVWGSIIELLISFTAKSYKIIDKV